MVRVFSAHCVDFVGCSLLTETQVVWVVITNLFFCDQRKLLITTTQDLKLILHCTLQPPPLLYPPSIPLCSPFFFYSSSFCPPSPPAPPFSSPVYSSSFFYRCTGMLWCICLQHNSSPDATTVFWLVSTPSPPLPHSLPPSHWSQCSPTCLPVANKASPLFVGASFWRGRLRSKLIVHSLAFAQQLNNLTP